MQINKRCGARAHISSHQVATGVLDTDEAEGQGYFPLSYYIGFLDLVANNPDLFEVVTYDDFDWGADRDRQAKYPSELSNWNSWINASPARKKKIYILLQHDVDSFPAMTERVLREEERLGIPSNVMLFNRRLHRTLLERRGQFAETEYPIDWNYLDHLVRNKGFVAGYHCNAYERSQFNQSLAVQLFREDLQQMRTRIRINYFSAHGGPRDADGQSNSILNLPLDACQGARWVHNGGGPVFAGEYSDGGIRNSTRPPRSYDLRSFIAHAKPGNRYRVLTHPQYFSDQPVPVPTLCGMKWYDEALAVCDEPNQKQYWAAEKMPVQIRTPSLVRSVAERVIRKARPKPISKPKRPPVFIRAVSRSGGTLVVTMLDAHPEIAMSYELYPNLLDRSKADETPGDAEYADETRFPSVPEASSITRTLTDNLHQYWNLFGRHRTRNIKTFFNRCRRSGISDSSLRSLYYQHVTATNGLDSTYGQLRFIERCGIEKMKQKQKPMWGAKCSNQLHAYHTVWPDACFIDVVRDGRDVLASQLNTGSFSHDIESVGKKWADTHALFERFVATTGARGFRVSYEELAQTPETGAKKLCELIGVEFNSRMLNFHEEKLTIFQKETGHLSKNRLAVPVDDSQVGRWKRDLSVDQLSRFERVAGDRLIKLGYK